MGVKVATALIQAGICGLVTRVRAEGDDEHTVRLTVESDCSTVERFAAELAAGMPVSALAELKQGHGGAILGAARKHLRGACAACIVPAGVFKAMQVAAGLALPADAHIQLELAP